MERLSALVSGKAILLFAAFCVVALACEDGVTQQAGPAIPTAAHRVFSEEYIKLSDTSLTVLPEEEARRLRAQIVATINQLPEAYSQKIRSVSVGLFSDANITMRWAELQGDGELLLNVFGETPAERERRLGLAFEELTAQAEGRSTAWAQQRLEALVGLYGFTEAGVKWMRNFHLRQMVGEPFWGGSYNKTDRTYGQTWAGVGSWVTIQTKMHEVQHTSWGAFTVTGRPDLSWTLSPEGQPVRTIGETAALAQYHADVEEFIKSAPPAGYEMFHTLLTQISRHDVMHTADADVIVLTGGNLNLIPPSLRPYYGQFLKAGEFQTWDETLSWYLGLSDADRDIADAYLLFSLLVETLSDVERSALTPEVPSRLSEAIREIVLGEERQELLDFAD